MDDTAIVYNCGGIGDYIQFTQAIIYALKNYKYLKGKIFVKPFFHELAKYWLIPHLDGRYKIHVVDDYNKNPVMARYHNMIAATHGVFTTLNNPIINVGFVCYAGLDKVPQDYNHFPEIDCTKIDIKKFNLPEKYCVITTMATSEVRTLKPVTINSITKYMRSLGIEPLFLGKSKLDPTVNYEASTSSEVDYKNGIDLRDKTSLLEAAAIMNSAKIS